MSQRQEGRDGSGKATQKRLLQRETEKKTIMQTVGLPGAEDPWGEVNVRTKPSMWSSLGAGAPETSGSEWQGWFMGSHGNCQAIIPDSIVQWFSRNSFLFASTAILSAHLGKVAASLPRKIVLEEKRWPETLSWWQWEREFWVGDRTKKKEKKELKSSKIQSSDWEGTAKGSSQISLKNLMKTMNCLPRKTWACTYTHAHKSFA